MRAPVSLSLEAPRPPLGCGRLVQRRCFVLGVLRQVCVCGCRCVASPLLGGFGLSVHGRAASGVAAPASCSAARRRRLFLRRPLASAPPSHTHRHSTQNRKTRAPRPHLHRPRPPPDASTRARAPAEAAAPQRLRDVASSPSSRDLLGLFLSRVALRPPSATAKEATNARARSSRPGCERLVTGKYARAPRALPRPRSNDQKKKSERSNRATSPPPCVRPFRSRARRADTPRTSRTAATQASVVRGLAARQSCA